MKKYPLILLCFFPLFSLAQSNYKSGYVINLKGDTLRGYINFKEWSSNPKNIDFRSALNDKTSQLGLADINYFEINGYTSYRAYSVSISTNTVDFNSPPVADDTSSITGTAFLKVLEKGRYVTLYAYKDALKQRFYIKDNDAVVPTELQYGMYKDQNSENSIIDKNTYRAQLLQIAEKYNVSSDNLIQQVQQSQYKDYILIPIAEKINGNNAGKNYLISNNPPVRFYAGAAFVSNSLKFTNGDPFYGAQHYTSGAPKISIGADVFTNPDVGHLIFRLEMGYSPVSFNLVEPENPIAYAANPISGIENLKMNIIFITPQIIYNFYNAPMLKVFADAGYSINVLSYPTTTFSQTQDGKVINTEMVQGIEASKSNSSNFMFKGGVVISKRFEIYAAYYLSAQITNSFSFNSNFSTFQFGANYFIGKVAK
jgi:hypothetical protein